jgi:hypothetical protein
MSPVAREHADEGAEERLRTRIRRSWNMTPAEPLLDSPSSDNEGDCLFAVG